MAASGAGWEHVVVDQQVEPGRRVLRVSSPRTDRRFGAEILSVVIGGFMVAEGVHNGWSCVVGRSGLLVRLYAGQGVGDG